MQVPGVSSAGLMTTLQPAASALASLRAGRLAGKFHGVKAATGPTGWRITDCERMPSTRGGTRRPYRRLASSAWKSMMSADSVTSRSDSASGLPCSRVSTCAIVFACARMFCAAARRMLQRSSALLARHCTKPRRADAAASASSSRPASGSCAMVASVAGLTTARRPPAVCVRHWPAMCSASSG
ncbi:hypothetical protein D9M69_521400 [compost metagenome]